ncbi:MAG: ComEC/Rec2 family competence protein [bacterium]
MPKSKVFLIVLVSVLLGVAGQRWLGLEYWHCLLVIGAGIVILLAEKRVLVVGLALAGFGVGLLRVAIDPPLQIIPEGKGEFVGRVVQPPDIRRDHIKYTIQITNNKSQNTKNIIEARVLVKSSLYPVYDLGDVISFNCFIRHPGDIEGFAYDKYLALNGITASCSSYYLTLEKSGSWSWAGMLFQGRQWVNDQLNKVLPEPESSFTSGLLIGARRGLPEWLMESFNRTGTTHLIALSGFNITIITNIIMLVAIQVIGRKRAFWLVLVAVSLFVMFVGGQASIVRAGIMGMIASLGLHIGRPSRGLNALILSGVLMVIASPRILLDDVGFQLSFAATLGLISLSGHAESLFSFVPEKLELRQTLSATTAATVFTLPIILSTFGRISLVSLPVNLLVLPFIPIAMALGVLGVVGSLFGASVGIVFALPAWLVLRLIIMVVQFFSVPDWALINFGNGVGYWSMVLYVPIFFFVVWLNKRSRLISKPL